jgi:hypothetical protein
MHCVVLKPLDTPKNRVVSGLTFRWSTGMLEKQGHNRLTRVERTKYGMWLPTAIRRRVEVRNGSAHPERLRERPAEENFPRFALVRAVRDK